MSTSVVEQFADHSDSLKVDGKLKASQLIVGSRGTNGWVRSTVTLVNATQGGTPVNVFSYNVVGKICYFNLKLAHTTGAGTHSGTLFVVPPAAVPLDTSDRSIIIGQGFLVANSSGTFVVCARRIPGDTRFVLNLTSNTAGPGACSDGVATGGLNSNTSWVLELSGFFELD